MNSRVSPFRKERSAGSGHVAEPGLEAAPATADPNSQSVVEIDEVRIDYNLGYGKHRVVHAVGNVSATIHRGEKLVILGPSGCGKSTLLMAIGGFMPITSGVIKVNGRRVTHPSLERIMVFQDFNQLFPWKTVLENVKWGIKKRHAKLAKDEVTNRARRQLELVGLSEQENQHPNTLSGGQKQRCAIARSFAATPEVLLMDEPFGALDAINRERMQQELNKIWSEQETPATIAFVTHDVSEAVLLGHRILVMTGGPASRVRSIVENKVTGRSTSDPGAMNLHAELRELLKEEMP